MTKTLDELRAMLHAALRKGYPIKSNEHCAALESALRELITERDTLKDALWKACGDDEQSVNAYIESQQSTPPKKT